ncbi:hypothetical protein F4680DRAFT_448946 [Xylaria scruposa]|nr:hypothetical protein F4680DRAFT_448946 [Xylaria scruposa]
MEFAAPAFAPERVGIVAIVPESWIWTSGDQASVSRTERSRRRDSEQTPILSTMLPTPTLIWFLAVETRRDAALMRFAVAVLCLSFGVAGAAFVSTTMQGAYGSYIAASIGVADVPSTVCFAGKSWAITISDIA